MFQKFDTKTCKQRKNETYIVWIFILKDLMTKMYKIKIKLILFHDHVQNSQQFNLKRLSLSYI